MDVRQLTQLFSFAASGSLILLGSTAVVAGHRSYEQPTRPHISAACAPNWGFNQTCWSRFPPVPGCLDTGCDNTPGDYENLPSLQLLYTPQHSLLLPDPHIVSPVDGNSQAPISVFPNSVPQSGFGGMPAPNGLLPSVPPPQQFAPSRVPSIPDASSIPESPVPGPLSPLPPLPAPPLPVPPLPVPSQSSLQPDMIMGPNRQLIARPVSASKSILSTSARYGHVRQSVLPPVANYPTISVEPLRRTPHRRRAVPAAVTPPGRTPVTGGVLLPPGAHVVGPRHGSMLRAG